MPLYDYHCKSCNADFEHLALPSHEEVQAICPACNSEDTEKMGISTFASPGIGDISCGGGCGGCSGHCG